MKQLQAKRDGTHAKQIPFTISKETDEQMKFIQEFTTKVLSLNPAKSVIMRNAIYRYYLHLTGLFPEVYKLSNKDDRESAFRLMAIIDQEREDLWNSAGRLDEYRSQ